MPQMIQTIESKKPRKPKKPKKNTGGAGGTTNSVSSANRYPSYSGGGGGGYTGGYPSGGGGANYFGIGRGPGYNWKEARKIIREQTQGTIRELRRQRKGERRNMQFDVNKLNALFNRQQGDLNYIFGEAKDYIAGQGAKMDQGFNNARSSLENLYSQFAAESGAATAARRDAAMQELARLGIQQAGMGQFDADANAAALQMDTNQASANANLTAMQNATGSVGNLLSSMAEGSRVSALGRAENSRSDAIAQRRHEWNQFQNDILQQIINIKKQRPELIRDLALQLQQQRFGQFMDRAQANFGNQMSVNRFNLDLSQFNARNFWEKAQLEQEAAQAAALANGYRY